MNQSISGLAIIVFGFVGYSMFTALIPAVFWIVGMMWGAFLVGNSIGFRAGELSKDG